MVVGEQARPATASTPAAPPPRPRPAPIWRSSSNSGPTPSGNRLTTMTKNTSAAAGVGAAAQRDAQVALEHRAQRHQPAAGGIGRRRRRHGITAACCARVSVRRRRLTAPGSPAARRRPAPPPGGWSAPPGRRARSWASIRPSSQAVAARVERVERLVQHPQRAALPSGSRASAARRRWPCDSVRTGTCSRPRSPASARAWRAAASSGAVAAQAQRDLQVLQRRQVVLQRRGMAQVDQLAVEFLAQPGAPAGPATAPGPAPAPAGRTACAAGWSCRRRWRPTTRSNWPGRSVALTPRNRLRRPRTQPRSRSSSPELTMRAPCPAWPASARAGGSRAGGTAWVSRRADANCDPFIHPRGGSSPRQPFRGPGPRSGGPQLSFDPRGCRRQAFDMRQVRARCRLATVAQRTACKRHALPTSGSSPLGGKSADGGAPPSAGLRTTGHLSRRSTR